MGINIGMTDKQRETVAKGLSKLLADSYSLYLKTHNYHWNVTGPQFNSLHAMFETQYTELAAAVDEIAERIRALGHLAPGSYTEFAKLSSIKDGDNTKSANGSRGAYLPRDLPSGRRGWRRTHRRPADHPHAAAREERLDAALAAGMRLIRGISGEGVWLRP